MGSHRAANALSRELDRLGKSNETYVKAQEGRGFLSFNNRVALCEALLAVLKRNISVQELVR